MEARDLSKSANDGLMVPEIVPGLGGPTPATEDVAKAIKKNIRRIWDEAQRARPQLTALGLGERLGLSSGSISKLINNDESHFWPAASILVFCAYCGVEVDEVIGSRSELRGFFNSFSGQPHQPDPQILDESYRRIREFYAPVGITIPPAKLGRMAYDVACIVERDETDDFDLAIRKVLAAEAIK